MSLTEAEQQLQNYKCVIDNDVSYLGDIEEQSNELCIYAIDKDYTCIQYIRDQTYDLCKCAIDKDIRALQFIREQTVDVCKYAIDKNVSSLYHIREQTEELCKYGINKYIRALEFIREHTEELCIYALNIDYEMAIEYINNFSDRVCRKMIDIDPRLLANIPNQTEEICILAVMKEPSVIRYVMNKTNSICRIAVEQDYSMIRFINQRDESNKEFIYGLCIEALLQHPCALQFIKIQTTELCELAIECSSDEIIMRCIKNQTFDICRQAINKYGVSVLEYIRSPDIETYKYAMNKNFDETLHYVNLTEKPELIEIIKIYININSVNNMDFKQKFSKEKYNFMCPIFREETNASGYIIKEHITYDGSQCCPRDVICEEAFIELQKNNICYICRNNLDVKKYVFIEEQ